MEARRSTQSGAVTASSAHHQTRRIPFVCLVCFLFFVFERISVVQASSPVPTETLTPLRNRDTTMTDASINDIRIVFSDVDGTLVHYPEDPNIEKEQDGNRILKLPPSATGMQGIISSRTMVYCREVRQTQKLVLISGMRTSTLLKRLPYLPRADAYCSEAGGRIFYPCEPNSGGAFTPVSFDGATPKDLTPFGLKEDLEWRSRMEKLNAAGTQGYGDTLGSEAQVPLSERSGLLWDYARTLMKMGYVLDTKGYSTCFRVNRKQQTTILDEEFDALMNGKASRPAELGSSVNLGCVDFYPVESGKKNCCLYLANKLGSPDNTNDALSKHAICLCDDDNDLEMALACQHAFVPGVSSDSVAAVVQAHPTQITATGGPGKELEGTSATEKALELVLERIHRVK